MAASIDLGGMNSLSTLLKPSDRTEDAAAAANGMSDQAGTVNFSNDATSVDIDLDEGLRQWARDETGYVQQSLNDMAVVQLLDPEQYAQAVSDIADRLDGAASTYARAGGSSMSDQADATAKRAEDAAESAEDAQDARDDADAAADDASADDADATSADDADAATATASAGASNDADSSDGTDAAATGTDSASDLDADTDAAAATSDDDDADSDGDSDSDGDAASDSQSNDPTVSQQIASYLATQTPSDRDDAFMAQVKHLAGRIKATFDEAKSQVDQGTDLDAQNRMDMMQSHMTDTLRNISHSMSTISGSGATQGSLTTVAVTAKTGDAGTLKGSVDLTG